MFKEHFLFSFALLLVHSGGGFFLSLSLQQFIDFRMFCNILQEACQNYIRVLTMTTPGILLACGTNSFRPMCHFYNITGSEYHIEKSKPGQALCPYGPQHNSTSVFVGELSAVVEIYFLIRKLHCLELNSVWLNNWSLNCISASLI